MFDEIVYVSIRYNFKGTHQIQMNEQRLKPTNEIEKKRKKKHFLIEEA